MKKQTKIVATLLSLLLLVTACVGIAVSADGEKALTVISQNVEYADNLHLYYAVYPENVDVDGLVLNVYTENPDVNAEAEILATVANHEEVVLADSEGITYTCRAFKTPGVALKNMATKFYVQAVAKDGTKSPVKTYSVVEYFNEMIYNAEDAADVEAYEKMLAAGDAAQHLLNYYPNDNKNDIPTNYKYVVVKNGTANGFKKGVYLVGDEISLNYTGADYADKWNLLNKDGEIVATVLNGEAFTVSESILCVPHTNRGTGIYADGSATYDYTDKVPEIAFTNQSGAAVENAHLYAETVNNGGDNALVLVNGDHTNEAYVNIPSAYGVSNTYSFETDLRLSGDIAGLSSTRSNSGIFHIYYGGSTFINWAFGSVAIVVDNTDADNPVYKLTATNFEHIINVNEWVNFRVDFEDVKLTERTIKYYVNGELIATDTKTSASTNSISQLRVVMPQSSSGTLYLDNTFFGPVVSYGSRGEGTMASNANTLVFDGTTATAISELMVADKNQHQKLSATQNGTLDGGGSYDATIVTVDNDSALRIKGNSAAESTHRIAADKVGTKYVFETDMMLESGSTSRSDTVVFQFIGTIDGSTNWFGIASPKIIAETVDGVTTYKFIVDGVSYEIELKEWFNLRIEIDNSSVKDNAVRYYINGELIHERTNTQTTTALRYIKIWSPSKAQGVLYLDNTYYSAQ